MASCLLHDSSCVRPKHSGCVPMWAYAECQNPTCAKVLAPERPFRLEHSKIMSNNVLWGSGAPKKKPANSPSCNHSRVLLKYLSVPSCTLPQPSVPSCRVLRRFNHRQSPPVSVLKWPITVLATLLYKSIRRTRTKIKHYYSLNSNGARLVLKSAMPPPRVPYLMRPLFRPSAMTSFVSASNVPAFDA